MREEIVGLRYEPKISVVMPICNTDGKWLEAAVNSLIQQAYANWELCVAVDAPAKEHVMKILEEYQIKDARLRVTSLEAKSGTAAASNMALSMAQGEFVAFLGDGDELTLDALYEVVKLLNEHPDTDYIYTDEDQKDPKGRRVKPFFKPDWSPDLLLSMNYVGHLSVIRKCLLDEVGGFRLGFDGSEDYDLILRVTERTNKIAHIAKPVYSQRKIPESQVDAKDDKICARESARKALQDALDRRRIKGQVLNGNAGHYRIKYNITSTPLVSIIIPTRDRVDLLKRCIESIESKTTYEKYEIVIVDNNSTDAETLSYLESLKHKVLRFNEGYNFSKMNNFAVKQAKGKHLVFLNNDTEVVEPGWLDAMLEHSQRPEVGIVGAALLYPSNSLTGRDGTTQHAGVVLWIRGVSGHAFRKSPMNRENYFNLHRVIRNCGAVTFACAMMRKDVFEQFDGLSEDIPVSFNDVDLCLRIRERGYLIVYTPHAVLYHHELATRGRLHPPEDETYILDRWGRTIARGDPYYNPNLTSVREDFSLMPKSFNVRALSVLFDLYHLRFDLQRAYPEVMEGNYQRLVDWAAECGITIDGLRNFLRPYHAWYAENCSERIKPLAAILALYNIDSHLQKLFPEVLRQDYKRLIAWASEITEEEFSRNPTLKRLLPYLTVYSKQADSINEKKADTNEGNTE
jgi:GT2 family glycosyltransferase